MFGYFKSIRTTNTGDSLVDRPWANHLMDDLSKGWLTRSSVICVEDWQRLDLVCSILAR